jgi:Lrp/AsnC family leucine-responsive transcriptional regulator
MTGKNTKSTENYRKIDDQLDAFDLKILDVVSRDARITVTELSDQVGLSKTPCHSRLKRLETQGYILGYRALLDPVKLGLDHIAFVEVKLSDTRATALKEFNAEVRKLPQVEQCHMIAGGFDYLLKVRTCDMGSYRNLLGQVLSVLPHVAQTSTYVAMEAVKDSTVLG